MPAGTPRNGIRGRPALPEWSDLGFLEDGRRAIATGEMKNRQGWFDLGIVGHCDDSAFASGPVESAAAIGAVAPAISAGRSHAARAAAAAAATSSS